MLRCSCLQLNYNKGLCWERKINQMVLRPVWTHAPVAFKCRLIIDFVIQNIIDIFVVVRKYMTNHCLSVYLRPTCRPGNACVPFGTGARVSLWGNRCRAWMERAILDGSWRTKPNSGQRDDQIVWRKRFVHSIGHPHPVTSRRSQGRHVCVS